MPIKPRGIITIVAIIIIILIVVAAVASSGSGARKTGTIPIGVKVCTVQGDIGVLNVKISNLRTGTSIVKTASNLPFSFNFTQGDTLQFNVAVEPNYTFNAWVFNSGTFDNHNPLTLKPSDSIVMTVTVLMDEIGT